MKETRDRIIKQALIYFSQNDYDGASLNDIAGALGITKGAIYHYFGSKDELFKESVIHGMNDLKALFCNMSHEMEGVSFKEMLEMWFNFGAMLADTKEVTGLDFLTDYGNTVYLIFAALKKFPEVKELLDNTYTEAIEGLSLLLTAAQERGEINRELDTKALAFEMAAFSEGAMLMGRVMSQIDLMDLGKRTFANFWLRVKS